MCTVLREHLCVHHVSSQHVIVLLKCIINFITTMWIDSEKCFSKIFRILIIASWSIKNHIILLNKRRVLVFGCGNARPWTMIQLIFKWMRRSTQTCTGRTVLLTTPAEFHITIFPCPEYESTVKANIQHPLWAQGSYRSGKTGKSQGIWVVSKNSH